MHISGKTSCKLAEHYRWGDNCDGWRLASGDILSVIEERMPPGTTETEHHHERARQFFYILSGTLTMDLGQGKVIRLNAGEGLEIAPGLRHRAHNTCDTETRFLVCSTPSTRDDRITVIS